MSPEAQVKMLTAVKEALRSELFELIGMQCGGSISSGASYRTDGEDVFVKWNNGSNALAMFEGEKEGLIAILATNTIKCAEPIKVVPLERNGGAAFVIKNADLRPLSSLQQAKLGEQLAKMHRKNSMQIQWFARNDSRITKSLAHEHSDSKDETDGGVPTPITQFGFHVPTSCGYHSLDNCWKSNWDEFYLRQRLHPLVGTLIKTHSDRELIHIWPRAAENIEKILHHVKDCQPALLHGDLWSGNVGSVNGEPMIFDPGAFYGHSEFDLGICNLFGGFSKHFFESYYSIMPKTSGWEERLQVYELFHHLNHWNHFGSNSYKAGSMKLLKIIAKADVGNRR